MGDSAREPLAAAKTRAHDLRHFVQPEEVRADLEVGVFLARDQKRRLAEVDRLVGQGQERGEGAARGIGAGRCRHVPRSLSGYWDGPRFERRRTPPGAWGLRVYAASLVVDDAPASLSSSLLASAAQAPGARGIPIPGQAPSLTAPAPRLT